MNTSRRLRVNMNTIERVRDGIAEVGLIVALFMAYEVTRGIAAGKEAVAFGHAREVMHIEQKLGLFHEIGLQTWFMTEPGLIRFLNFIYAYTHLAAIIIFAVWVYLFHSERYPMIRNTFLLILGTGLTIYILFPLAPPRFFPYTGFVDTLKLYSGVNYDQQSVSMLYNPFAAMPSLHVGFALFSGIGVIQVGRRLIYWIIGIAYPILMALSVVGTANHYILDVIVGAFITITAFIVMPRLTAFVSSRVNRDSQFEPRRTVSA
jgi:membrane-associated phospholipid phosphatase